MTNGSCQPAPLEGKTSRAPRFVIFLFALCACAQPPATQQKQSPPIANVVVGNQTLFPIRVKLGPFSPEERAAAASARLDRLVTNVLISPDVVTTNDNESSTDILAGDLVVTTVTDRDAAAAGKSRLALASQYATQIRSALTSLRGEYTYKSLIIDGLYAVLTTLVLVLLLIGIRRASPRVYAAIERFRRSRVRTIRIQSLELVSAARIAAILRQTVRLARLALTILLLYFYIPLVFSFFPWTREFGATLLDYVLNPIRAGWAAMISYLPNLLVVFVIVGFAYLVIRLGRFIFREIERGTITWPGFYPEWAMPTFKIVELLILAFTLVVMFPYLPGSDSPAFRGVSIFLGILFSLGSTSAIANIVAGVILTYTRAFKVGDRVKIADTVGDVVSKTLLATHVRTIKNVHITVPNSLVLGSHIINYSVSAQEQPLILHTTVSIGYDAPWRQVHALLIAAANGTAGILQDPAPFVLQTSLDDFYVSYEINACTGQPSRMAVIYSELNQNIQDQFNEAGLEIMSPHFNAVRDGNAIAIPENYQPEGYTPPGFRLFRPPRPSVRSQTP